MTGMVRHLCALAGDNSAFGSGCSPTSEPLFPSEVWEKACKSSQAYLKFSVEYWLAESEKR
jgi:hypothetical protein